MTLEEILDELEEFTDSSFTVETRLAALTAMLLHYDLDRIAAAVERMAGPVDGVDNSIVGVLRERSGNATHN